MISGPAKPPVIGKTNAGARAGPIIVPSPNDEAMMDNAEVLKDFGN